MVNGTLSRILYIGAFGMIALCVVGYILLAMAGKPAPNELNTALVSAFALVAGSHITPPNVHKVPDPGVVGADPAAIYKKADAA